LYDPERSGRMKVLQEVERGHLTQKPAGAQLKLRERWGRKLPACLGKEGGEGFCTGCGGSTPPRLQTSSGC